MAPGGGTFPPVSRNDAERGGDRAGGETAGGDPRIRVDGCLSGRIREACWSSGGLWTGSKGLALRRSGLVLLRDLTRCRDTHLRAPPSPDTTPRHTEKTDPFLSLRTMCAFHFSPSAIAYLCFRESLDL